MSKRVQLTITGEVQGVWFRKSAKEKADELKVTGWVKNNSDGSVVANAQGDNGPVELFITWCYRGPENAVVTGVDILKVQEDPAETDFTILR